MNRISFFLISFISLSINLFSQSNEKESSAEFKPSGDLIIRSFFDYSTGLGHVNSERGFDLTRAFVGYNYKITPTLEARVLLDGAAGRTSDDGFQAYVRNAYIRWQDYGFKVTMGEINLLQFKLQDSYWKHRYVMNMYQDRNKMGHSVDLGVTAQYTFNQHLSADISITNGEGYKKVKKDKSIKYAVAMTTQFLDGFAFRAYADYYNEDETGRDELPTTAINTKYTDQYSTGLFLGYKNNHTSSGIEYNRIFNKGFVAHKNYQGLSAYTSYKLNNTWQAYGRYDYTTSHTPDGFGDKWNDLDGQLLVLGIQFRPVHQLKFSPNIRLLNPDNRKSEQYIFVNVEFNLK